MRVGIVGAGFVGLTAAYRLAQKGVQVEVFEALDRVGGFASGFSHPDWEWPLEQFYHHIFSNDRSIIRLSHEIGWPPIFFRPTTSIFFERESYPLDSASHLLRFPHLDFSTKLRMGAVLSFLKLFPFWRLLENLSADEFLRWTMGVHGYETIWKPLLIGKFGPFAEKVNAAWFWARIQKRTPRLGYFERGFQGLADCLKDRFVEQGGSINLKNPVSKIDVGKDGFLLCSAKGAKQFDRVLVTTSNPSLLSMLSDLTQSYRSQLRKLVTLDALNIIMVLDESLMGNVYWLNVTDTKEPFLVVVEHTNMVNTKHYGGNHIVYLGAYLQIEHSYFKLTKDKLVMLAINQLRKIKTSFSKKEIKEAFVFRGHGAQLVMPVNYSTIRPNMQTPIENLFLANMSLVYPWDRGTNYAVTLGEEASDRILK
jgi:protoporphyrinogen oxidase